MENENPFTVYQDDIISHAALLLRDMELAHYRQLSRESCSLRYRRLLHIVLECMEKRSVIDMVTYMGNLAHERFHSGYSLQEVQAACNVLEEVMRYYLLHMPEPADFQALSDRLNLICRIFCAGKDILSDTYVIMATERRQPDIDVNALFNGT